MSEKTVSIKLSGSCKVWLEREMMVTPEDAEELRQLVRNEDDEELAAWFDWKNDIQDADADEITVVIDGEEV